MAQRAAEPAAHFQVWKLELLLFSMELAFLKDQEETGVWYWEEHQGTTFPRQTLGIVFLSLCGSKLCTEALCQRWDCTENRTFILCLRSHLVAI